MDYNNIFKIWGLRLRLLLTDTSEIDLIQVKKDCFCSIHFHKNKVNKFYIIEGKLRIESEYGKILLEANDSFEIRPPIKHRFFAEEDTVAIELAYVENGKIDAKDIMRFKQGGKIIKGEELTEDEIRLKGLLEL